MLYFMKEVRNVLSGFLRKFFYNCLMAIPLIAIINNPIINLRTPFIMLKAIADGQF